MRPITIITLLACLLLYGCNASTAKKAADKKYFIGEKKEVLLTSLGEPKHILKASPPGAPATHSYVYDIVENGRPCAASYLVSIKTNTIISYRCF